MLFLRRIQILQMNFSGGLSLSLRDGTYKIASRVKSPCLLNIKTSIWTPNSYNKKHLLYRSPNDQKIWIMTPLAVFSECYAALLCCMKRTLAWCVWGITFASFPSYKLLYDKEKLASGWDVGRKSGQKQSKNSGFFWHAHQFTKLLRRIILDFCGTTTNGYNKNTYNGVKCLVSFLPKM